MFSVVCGKQKTRKKGTEFQPDLNTVMIRARAEAHIQLMLDQYVLPVVPNATFVWSPLADYRYRIIVTREQWQTISAKVCADITYDNFKSQCHKNEAALGKDYIRLLHQLWAMGMRMQTERERNDIYPLFDAGDDPEKGQDYGTDADPRVPVGAGR